MCPIVTIGALKLKSYLLFTYVAFFGAAIYFYYMFTVKEHISKVIVFRFLVLLIFVQMIGGWVLPSLYRLSKVGPFPLYQIPKTGRYFHSVFLTSLLFYIVYVRSMKWPLPRFLDYFAIAACLMSAIGRIGCFMTGCCGGKPSDLPWAMTFPHHDHATHPTQLYHFFFEALVLLPLLFWIQKEKKSEGQTFWVFIFVYSLFRFSVEFFRTNPIFIAGLTHAQVFSLFAAVLGGFVLWRRSKH